MLLEEQKGKIGNSILYKTKKEEGKSIILRVAIKFAWQKVYTIGIHENWGVKSPISTNSVFLSVCKLDEYEIIGIELCFLLEP